MKQPSWNFYADRGRAGAVRNDHKGKILFFFFIFFHLDLLGVDAEVYRAIVEPVALL